MPSLQEYFNNDFKELSIDKTFQITVQKFDDSRKIIGQENIEIKQRIRHEINSSARLFTFYVPNAPNTLEIIIAILNQINALIKDADGVGVIGGFSGDVQIGKHKSFYSNRIYFYTEDLLLPQEIANLNDYCEANEIFLTIRSSDYIKKKMEIDKPVAFISHDSRDKELIAARISHGLSSRLCTVWYDEFSLKVGDSLRESIEGGIKRAKKCVLVITPNYLNNPGWGKKEFNSIFTREMIFNEKVVLPIWYGVTKEDVYNYSPSLADTFALLWPSPANKTEKEYNEEVEKILSKIHTAVTSDEKT